MNSDSFSLKSAAVSSEFLRFSAAKVTAADLLCAWLQVRPPEYKPAAAEGHSDCTWGV